MQNCGFIVLVVGVVCCSRVFATGTKDTKSQAGGKVRRWGRSNGRRISEGGFNHDFAMMTSGVDSE